MLALVFYRLVTTRHSCVVCAAKFQTGGFTFKVCTQWRLEGSRRERHTYPYRAGIKERYYTETEKSFAVYINTHLYIRVQCPVHNETHGQEEEKKKSEKKNKKVLNSRD